MQVVVHLKNKSKVLTGARKVTIIYIFFCYYYFYVVKLSLCNSIC